MKVTVNTTMDLEDILKATPAGKRATFRVTRISSKTDHWLLDELVYVQDGCVWDAAHGEEHGNVEEFGLHFYGYLDSWDC